ILAETDGSGRVAGPLCGDWLWGAASFPSVPGKGAVFSCFSSPPLLDPNPLGAMIDTTSLVLRICALCIPDGFAGRPERFNGTRAEIPLPVRLTSNLEPPTSRILLCPDSFVGADPEGTTGAPLGATLDSSACVCQPEFGGT